MIQMFKRYHSLREHSLWPEFWKEDFESCGVASRAVYTGFGEVVRLARAEVLRASEPILGCLIGLICRLLII